MNTVMEPKLNMAADEKEVSSRNSNICSERGDQKVEPIETTKNLEKCASQPDLSTESCKSKSVPTSPIIKCPVRTASITNIQSENRAAKLAATTRLTTSKLRPPTLITPKPLTRKTSNLSTSSGTLKRIGATGNSLPKRYTPNSSKASSRESLKPVSIMHNSPRTAKKQVSIKFDLSTTKSTKPASKIPVTQNKLNKNKPAPLKGVHKRCDNGKEEEVLMEIRNDVECETECLELKNMQRRINTVTNTCIKIVNKTYDNEDVLELIKSIDLNECEAEKLKLVAQLFDMCSKEHTAQKEQSQLLKAENNDLKTQVNDFAVKIQEFRQTQLIEIEGPAVNSEILARENTISELKLQLEDSIFELNCVKVENEEKSEFLEQQEKQLKAYQDDISHMQAKISELQNKLNVFATSFENNEELQDQVEDLETKLNEKSAEYADTLHKAQQFFAEMLELKEKVKEMSEEKIRLQEEVVELHKRLHENKSKCMSEEQFKEAECAKSLEIDRLKVELFKARQIILHLKEDNERFQHLLELKVELKQALEQTETQQKDNLLQIKGQVEEKSNIIQDLTVQVNNKSIDCQDVLKTFNEKQLLICQQEHEIRMLKEGHRRSQFLRLKQEEKIARLEDKINSLQQMM